MCVCVCVCDLSYFQGHKLHLKPVDWGKFVQLGMKAVSSIGKTLIFGSVVNDRVRVRQVVVMVRVSLH